MAVLAGSRGRGMLAVAGAQIATDTMAASAGTMPANHICRHHARRWHDSGPPCVTAPTPRSRLDCRLRKCTFGALLGSKRFARRGEAWSRRHDY